MRAGPPCGRSTETERDPFLSSVGGSLSQPHGREGAAEGERVESGIQNCYEHSAPQVGTASVRSRLVLGLLGGDDVLVEVPARRLFEREVGAGAERGHQKNQEGEVLSLAGRVN